MSHVGVLPPLSCQPGLPAAHHHHPEQHPQLGHVTAAAAAMGMESSELMAVAHYQAQQLQRQLLAEQSGTGAMLPPSAQPTGGGLTQPIQQQGQQGQLQPGQDPLQSLVQQLLCLQQIEYFLAAQRGHK